MELWEKIVQVYPETLGKDWEKLGIRLQDDSDGQGAYIVLWEYSKPIPEGLKLGK